MRPPALARRCFARAGRDRGVRRRRIPRNPRQRGLRKKSSTSPAGAAGTAGRRRGVARRPQPHRVGGIRPRPAEAAYLRLFVSRLRAVAVAHRAGKHRFPRAQGRRGQRDGAGGTHARGVAVLRAGGRSGNPGGGPARRPTSRRHVRPRHDSPPAPAPGRVARRRGNPRAPRPPRR